MNSQQVAQAVACNYEDLGPDTTLSCGTNLAHCRLQPGEKVLDLGSGNGAEALAAARLVGPTGAVAGIDLTPAMVERAKSRAAQERQDGMDAPVDFVQGSIEALPFADESFDVVVSNCVINHALDKTAVYREIYRVLKAGGRMVVSDVMTKELLPEAIRTDAEAWGRCFGGAIPEADYMEALRVSGFPSIRVLKRREYVKEGYDFISLTFEAVK